MFSKFYIISMIILSIMLGIGIYKVITIKWSYYNYITIPTEIVYMIILTIFRTKYYKGFQNGCK